MKTNRVTFNWNYRWKDCILGNFRCSKLQISQNKENLECSGCMFRIFEKHFEALSSHRAFCCRTMMQSCLQDKQEWLSLCEDVKMFLLLLVVSHNADMLSLKVFLLIFLKNYAINRMETARVRIRNWASVQTETSSESWGVLPFTTDCFQLWSTLQQPAFSLGYCEWSPSAVPPSATCTQPTQL